MKRRGFLQSAACAVASTLLFDKVLRAAETNSPATLTLGEKSLGVMPKDFTGISIEAPQLYNPACYSAENRSLVGAFKNLSSNGVLRSGGHLSDVARWNGSNGDFSTPRQDAGIERGKTYWEWKLTDPSVRDSKDGAITPKSIDNLKAFLDATNWRLIYGLNFGCGSVARAADEASYVAKTMGSRLIAFQLGNECDQFGGGGMAFLRPNGYNFQLYYAEYLEFVAGVRAVVPNAQFGGPDVAGNMDWVKRFSAEAANPAIFLSSHYYAMGPAKNPAMDATMLLKPKPGLAKEIEQVHAATAISKGLGFRMTEGNSCFGGGKPDVSDAFASSLWGADYMLQCASAGYLGVNLHGGGDGYYTPIAVGPNLSIELRPLYFGMRFADQFAGAELMDCRLDTKANLTAYQAMRGRETLVALINKGPESVDVKLSGFAKGRHPASEMRLSAPALDAKTGIALTSAKAVVSGTVTMLPYSATILKWS